MIKAARNVDALARLDESIVELSIIALDAGRWPLADEHVRRALDAIDELLDLLPSFHSSRDEASYIETALSAAEVRLLPFLHTHLTYAEIALQLNLSRNTISTEVQSIFRKLGAKSRNEAVLMATRIMRKTSPTDDGVSDIA